MPRSALLVLAIVLSGCATQPMTYWAFPAGKDAVAFKADEATCNWALDKSACLAAKGYKPITQEQYIAIQVAAIPPADVVAQDMQTYELFIGKSTFTPSPTGASSLTLTGIVSGIQCTGFSELVKLVPGGVGSTGRGTVLCKDGRTINADLVYDSMNGGYGNGSDKDGGRYQFLFGTLNVDPEALRQRFLATFEESEAPPKVAFPTSSQLCRSGKLSRQ